MQIKKAGFQQPLSLLPQFNKCSGRRERRWEQACRGVGLVLHPWLSQDTKMMQPTTWLTHSGSPVPQSRAEPCAWPRISSSSSRACGGSILCPTVGSSGWPTALLLSPSMKGRKNLLPWLSFDKSKKSTTSCGSWPGECRDRRHLSKDVVASAAIETISVLAAWKKCLKKPTSVPIVNDNSLPSQWPCKFVCRKMLFVLN